MEELRSRSRPGRRSARPAAGAQHPDFMAHLDVEFANHYLRALTLAHTRPEAMARCWRVLHERRWSAHVTPLQFAMAGLNAHINHDLVLGLVATWQQSSEDPHSCHADFLRVNTVLAGLEDGIRRSFESGLLAESTASSAPPSITSTCGASAGQGLPPGMTLTSCGGSAPTTPCAGGTSKVWIERWLPPASACFCPSRHTTPNPPRSLVSVVHEPRTSRYRPPRVRPTGSTLRRGLSQSVRRGRSGARRTRSG